MGYGIVFEIVFSRCLSPVWPRVSQAPSLSSFLVCKIKEVSNAIEKCLQRTQCSWWKVGGTRGRWPLCRDIPHIGQVEGGPGTQRGKKECSFSSSKSKSTISNWPMLKTEKKKKKSHNLLMVQNTHSKVISGEKRWKKNRELFSLWVKSVL